MGILEGILRSRKGGAFRDSMATEWYGGSFDGEIGIGVWCSLNVESGGKNSISTTCKKEAMCSLMALGREHLQFTKSTQKLKIWLNMFAETLGRSMLADVRKGKALELCPEAESTTGLTGLRLGECSSQLPFSPGGACLRLVSGIR